MHAFPRGSAVVRSGRPGRPHLEVLEDRAVPAAMPLDAPGAPALALEANVAAARGLISSLGPATPDRQPGPAVTDLVLSTGDVRAALSLPGSQASPLAAQIAATLNNFEPFAPPAGPFGAVTQQQGVVVSGPTAFVVSDALAAEVLQAAAAPPAANAAALQQLGAVVPSTTAVTFRPEMVALGFPGRLVMPGTGVQARGATGDGPISQAPGLFLVGGSDGLPETEDTGRPPVRVEAAEESAGDGAAETPNVADPAAGVDLGEGAVPAQPDTPAEDARVL